MKIHVPANFIGYGTFALAAMASAQDAKTLGMDAYMDRHKLDAVLFPANAGAGIAAKPGYPSVLVPAGVKLEAVRADLEKIATDLMVDLKLQPAKG